jgi:hypothetical protein
MRRPDEGDRLYRTAARRRDREDHAPLRLAASLAAAPADAWVHDPDDATSGTTPCSDAPREVTFVDMDTFWATF